MYFKRLEMQGFKSFADPVAIDFHEGVTCIVGPNGSGKSNISDAIRWVLGEQSPKTLRSGRMDEVIFAGTARRKSRGMAEVTLVIDNSAGLLPIDYQEVAITRRMFRSGESEYLINRVPCRLRDVRELIMDTGIGVDGYSVVGQGRISDIVSGKPETRREILEEAAGIVKYRTKREESERRLASARQNLERVNDIIDEVGGRIGGLREDSVKATEYLELKDQQKHLEIGVTLKNIDAIELKSEYLKDELTEAANRIEEVKELREETDEAWQGVREQIGLLEQTADQIRRSLAETGETINRLSGERELAAERLKTAERDRGRLAEEAELYRQRLVQTESAIEGLGVEQAAAQARAVAALAELTEAERVYVDREAAVTELALQFDRDQSDMFELHRVKAEKSSEQNGLAQLGESFGKRREGILKEQTVRTDEAARLEVESEQAANRLAEIDRTIARTESERDRLREEATQAETQLSQARSEQNRLAVESGQAVARQKLLKEMEASHEGYQYGVRHILKSGLPGVIGAVADLVQVPAGYETAFETALGGALQNIVCATERAARAGVDSLKKHRAGRLTFLPLDTLRPRPNGSDKAFRGKPGYLGLAVELAGFDAACRPAMDYLLGRTAVVDTLEHAVGFSAGDREGFRFVTLEGELVNPAGAITGGQTQTKTAGIFERKAEIGRLKEQIDRLTQEGKACGTAIASREEELQSRRRHQGTVEQTLHDLLSDRQAAASEVDRLNMQDAQVSSGFEKAERELVTIQEELARIRGLSDQLTEELTELDDRAGSATHQSDRRREELAELRRAMAAASARLADCRVEANRCENEKARLGEQEGQMRRTIAEWETEIASREEARKRLEGETAALVQAASPIERELEARQAEQTEWHRRAESLGAQRVALNRRDDELRQRRAELDESLLHSQTLRHETELKLAQNDTRVENYKEKLWEDYELSYIQAIEYQKQEFSLPSALRELKQIRERLAELGEVNIGAIKEYEQVWERHRFLEEQRADLLSGMETLEEIIRELDQTIKRRFMEQFTLVAGYFREAFETLFGGGVAELRLEDAGRPLESGVEIVAQPPGKKLQNIQLLSGGEKTLTAIALMFSLLKARPTPFCILDEVEAALDDTNIQRFAEYLKNYEGIQFALVTHQKATMEYADVLYGVTMAEQGVSELLSLKLGDEIALSDEAPRNNPT